MTQRHSPRVRRQLHDDWTVVAASGPTEIDARPIPATVPGVVHLDLLAADLIPDPYLDNNEARLSWIGLVDWTYRTTFLIAPDAASAQRHELVFDGLDTVATITLNGSVIADVANQHRTHRIDVTDRLNTGENELIVAFRSPMRYANEQAVALRPRPRPYPTPFEAIRKSACSFGWDWGIATATSGIWRPVALESWSTARLGEVRVVAAPEGGGGTVTVSAQVDSIGDTPLQLRVSAADHNTVIPVDSSEVTTQIALDTVELWWPAGHGEQPLTDVTVELLADGDVIDTAHRRVGFRTVEWNTTPDADGVPFQLVINGRPIYIKGVNWIPDDAFFPRVTPERYRTRLEQAKSANINLVRVWGGGMYEDDAFFDLCDELGLLSWQDFLFACAAYSEAEPLRSEIEAEARDNMTRIAHHASLVLLTGNNENLWGYEDWGWKALLDGETWGAGYYYELFPSLIQELAPHVPYAPGSPFSPDGAHPNAHNSGTVHLWEQWNKQDYLTYRDEQTRFVAEFGWQAPPAFSTLRRALSDDPLTPESPGMIVHQKAIDGNEKLARGLVTHYRVPAAIDDWHWAMQLNQANAIAVALDWFRSNAPVNSGAVVWQLNDCWPVTSWAAIDGDGREKPLLHAIRRSFAPRVITIQPEGESLVAVINNDTDEEWNADVELRLLTFDGSAVAVESTTVAVPTRGSARVPVPAAVATCGAPAAHVLRADAEGVEAWWYFAEPRDLSFLRPALSASVTPVGDAYDVHMTTDVFVRDLTLLVDRIDPSATVDDALITLLPGQSHTFRVSGVANLAAADILNPLVARTANDLVAS